MIRLSSAFVGLLAVVLAAPAIYAQGSNPAAIELAPGQFTLTGPRARQQLVVVGQVSAEDPRDFTAEAALESSNPAVVRIEGGKAIPVADGTATITAKVGDKTAQAQVTVAQFGTADPISFQYEMLAALTKAGCNMGACHGSPSGKAGFRLSLRGYDPPLDTLTLRTEAYGRRTNVMDPDNSLILRKGLMEVAHGGGRRLKKGDAAHLTMRGWIAEGMPLDPPTEPVLDRIEIFPKKRVFQQDGRRQQTFVKGFFSDGSVKDLTALTVFSSSAESVAKVSESGLVEKVSKGEAAILARYLDKMDTAEIAFLEPTPGFAWNNPPEHNFIDQLVDEKLKQLQILPSGLCSDDEFLRRAYLDVTGRLPTTDETQAFLNDVTPEKRTRLIDQLLDSSDYASFWTMKLADVLRANSGKLNPEGVAKFNRWLYQSVLTDQPFDAFAKELLTAKGNTYENPAANYWKASREPSDATESTVQLFLGIRIQCAKCHNHPFERWSQDNYYGIGAAFVRVGRKKTSDKDEEVIFTSAGGEVTQPRTGKQMKVHLLLKGDVDVPPEQDRRAVFADWLAAPDNPFFAKAAVNRVWGHLLGRGIVDPVDDFRDSNPPSNPRLLEELAKQFGQNGFSRKWLVKAIMTSHTYQRSSRTNDFNKNDEIYFSHATTRMLTAEQLLDGICAVTSVPETFPNMPPGTRATELAEPPTDNYFLKIFGQPQREMVCECERSSDSNLSQALQMINGPTVHNKLRADNGRINTMIAAMKSDDEIIAQLYVAGVCRTPTTEELKTAKAHIAASGEANRRQALEDIGWAVLNSKEFLFQH